MSQPSEPSEPDDRPAVDDRRPIDDRQSVDDRHPAVDRPVPADDRVADAVAVAPADPAGADVDADAADPDDATGPARPPRRLVTVLVLAASILVVDQITKIIAVATLTPGESPSILGGLVYFSLIRNPGAAWSLGTGLTWVLALVACVVVVVIIRMASKLRSGWWAACLGMILGGAVGNLMDRFFRFPGFLHGHVVDFVSVFGPNAEHFPVFNVADSGITVGAILLVITAARGVELDGSRARSARAERRERATLSPHDEPKKSDMRSDTPDHG